MTDEAAHIAMSIRMLRCKRKLSQRDVADAIGVTQATVSSWENTGSIGLSHAVKLSDFFGVPLYEVAGRIESREAIPRASIGSLK